MKYMKSNYYIMLGCLFILASCETGLEVENPTFNVTAESNTYNVGEDVKFTFIGDADLISFYSGELQREYEYSAGRVVDVEGKDVYLEFSNAVSDGEQEDQLTLLASTDFNGDYDDLQSVKNANWIDITDSFEFSESSDFVSSGRENVTGLFGGGGPVYFAFKYVTKPQVENGFARNWILQNFTLSSDVTIDDRDIEVNITDQIHSGFRIVESHPENAPSRSVVTTTTVVLLGNQYQDPEDPIYDPENPIFDSENPIYDRDNPDYIPGTQRPEFVPYNPDSPWNDPETEVWAVSRPISLDQVDLGPDPARGIKGTSDTKMEEYAYSYAHPGTYTAVFVAKNATIDGQKEVVREIELTITE